MHRARRNVLIAAALVAMLAAVAAYHPTEAQNATPASPAPVEQDMHEFMEYAFEPAYNRLKQGLAAQPADNAAWKGIKSDALILAEGGNLLLIRPAEEDAAAWNELSLAVRKAGGELYAAGKTRNYAAARASYEAMLTRCNACHTKFAGGEHQLQP